MKYLTILLFFITIVAASAQTGTIRGKVFERSTGETLVGVTVVIKGTTTGIATDLDGDFALSVPAGVYDLQLSFISYQTIVIENVEVTGNEVTLLNNIMLDESTLELEEVSITAQAARTTEAALQIIKMRSPAILDGISSARITLIGDATAIEAAKRITGVTVEEGKYFYVRGLGDRYSKTTFNSMDIPGLDPDRNSLQLDILPTNLIDNIMVSKNFTADMPADFTGGLMNIETKDFPERKIMNVSVGTSFNPQVHFNPEYLTYGSGKTDLLGFDDGSRALPGRADELNIPTPISGHPESEVVDFIGSFNPELAASRQKSFVDLSASLSLGNQIDLNNSSSRNPKLGYILSLSYKSDYKFYDDIVNSEFQRYTDPGIYELRYAFKQNGEMGERNILAGAMGGLAYKTNNSKIRLMAMHLQNGESRAGIFNLDDNGEAVGKSGYIGVSDNLEYNQRSLTNLLLNGTHLFNDSGWEIDWRISPTISTSYDPDIRKTAFTFRAIDTLFMAGAAGNPSRIWRYLNETNLSSRLDISRQYKLFGHDAKLKAGASHTYKYRDYKILFYDMQFFGSQRWSDPSAGFVLDPVNIYPNRPNSVYYQSGNPDPNPNEYNSDVNNTGFYVSNEFSLSASLKIILGLRGENYIQRHTGRDQRYASGDTENGRNLDNEIVLESLDFFPSVNTIYSITENQNIRFTYSGTIARPSFKELSFAQILDPISDRIFNGSLFTYSDWAGKLKETRIQNLDIRWELFPGSGQLYSVSGFYKEFSDPIELVRIAEQQTSTEYQPRNVGEGLLYGIEFEISKDMDFLSGFMSDFNISGNLTLAKSQISMTESEFGSRKSFERDGETITSKRDMAGQSPYAVNAGVNYNNPDSGWAAGLFYNVKGPTLSIVGIGLYPDIYIAPFHSLNFSINKKIGDSQKTVIDFRITNLLDSRTESYFKSFNAENQVYSRLNPGRSFSLGLKYNFN